MIMKPYETISISEFKATCLAVLERVRRTGVPVTVTRRGEPVADVVPPSRTSATESWLGTIRGTALISGDLVEPVGRPDEWDVLKS